MGKKNRKKNKETTVKRAKIAFVDRPFEGIPGEIDLVALREVVPAAQVHLKTTKEYGAKPVTLVTLLPDGVPALRRRDGELLVALQTPLHSGDASRDVAYALIEALEIADGEVLTLDELPEPGPRLQEVIDWTGEFKVEVHETFDFWLSPDELAEPQTQQALEQLRAETIPSAKIAAPAVDGAYWCQMSKPFLRWARPEDEQAVIDGIARLQAKRALQVMPESKFLGAFRSCGIIVPVWELPAGTQPGDELESALEKFAPVIAKAIAEDKPLDFDERRAKAGIVSRQLTLR